MAVQVGKGRRCSEGGPEVRCDVNRTPAFDVSHLEGCE